MVRFCRLDGVLPALSLGFDVSSIRERRTSVNMGKGKGMRRTTPVGYGRILAAYVQTRISCSRLG